MALSTLIFMIRCFVSCLKKEIFLEPCLCIVYSSFGYSFPFLVIAKGVTIL